MKDEGEQKKAPTHTRATEGIMNEQYIHVTSMWEGKRRNGVRGDV